MDDELAAALRAVAETVAVEAADLVRERRRTAGAAVADSKSSDTDVVTAVDRESEAFLRRRLAELRPDDGFLGEEGGAGASTTGITWVVDPIDGTVNFLYGIGHYAVCVAAVLGVGSEAGSEETVAAAVVDVVNGEVFTAHRGGGATCDGRPLVVREEPRLEHRLVLTGFQYQPRIRALQGPAVARMITRVRDIRRNGSAALELCAVAAGRADAYVEEGLHLWDRAAAGLVATEAGAGLGVFRGAGGMDCVVCAPASSYPEMLALAADCGFLDPAEVERLATPGVTPAHPGEHDGGLAR